MGIETPKQPTLEEQAKIEAERTLSDAELIKGGAEYVVDEETGKKRLIASYENIEGIETQKSHDEQMELEKKQKEETKRIEESRSEVWEDIAKKWYRAPIKDIVEYYPELEKIKVTSLESNPELSLIQTKEVPEIATIIYSETRMAHSEAGGGLDIDIPDTRVKEGFIKIGFSVACACCKPESRFSRSERPEEDEKKKKEWDQQKKEDFKDDLQKKCTQNGIKYLIVRRSKEWLEEYGDLDGVEIMEVHDMTYESINEEIERSKGESIMQNLTSASNIRSNFRTVGKPLMIRGDDPALERSVPTYTKPTRG